MIRRSTFFAVACLASAAPVAGQDETALRRFFEGRSVVVKLEMPGTDDGVDVYPGTAEPVDFPKHARRLKEFGTAIRRGEEVLITKIRLKNDLIEFQLGGGGYGTFGDDTGTDVGFVRAPKTRREETLEREVKVITDPAARKKAQEELDQLRKERERADAANRAVASQAQQLKEANIRQRRAEGGSRFNLRYRGGVPDIEATPDAMMRALAEYVDFTPLLDAAAGRPGLHGEGDTRPRELRKGLLQDEVDELLGRPETISRRQEGVLAVSTSVYRMPDRVIEAEFVEGVLIRFTVRSR